VRENREAPLARIPPRCACEGLLRPDVVWFGEPLPYDLLKRAIRAVESCDLMLVIGTSGLVQPAASMADAALARGMPVVEINLDPTPLSDQATYALHGKAGEILPKLIA
jgi:NAD-dependent deacetylase